MERLGRPGDAFRGRLSVSQIEAICRLHTLPIPREIVPEVRGNEKVIYYLDDRFALQFHAERRDMEDLLLLQEIEEMPAPKVVAWIERDDTLGTSYLITEKCPGRRLDELWPHLQQEARVGLLETLGSAIAEYHAVRADEIYSVASRLELSHRVKDHSDCPLAPLETRARKVESGFGAIVRLLDALKLPSSDLFSGLESAIRSKCFEPFFGPGLTHEEPWAEHFIVDGDEGAFRLSGCVDFNWIFIADPAWDIVNFYVSILGTDDTFYDAYRRGYERIRAFPDDAEARLRSLAVDFDAWAILSLSGETEISDRELLWRGKSMPSGRRSWVRRHYERLRGWLGLSEIEKECLFRWKIGPW